MMVCAVGDRSFVLDIQCWKCKQFHIVVLSREDLLDWTSGAGPIEKILHYLSAGDRELLLSQTCSDCFDKMFSPDGIDNDD
jgi:hypothetical protein